MRYAMHQPTDRQGFTLAEVVIAAGLFAIVATMTVSAYCYAFRDAKICGSQIEYTARGRTAQQRITKYIENGRSAAVVSNGVNVYAISLTNYCRIAYLDADNTPSTEGNNELVYYPDGTTTNNMLVLCCQISAITTNTMFNIIQSTPCSVGIAFHIGDTTNATDALNGSYSGMGYQGINMRFTATPRNLLREYQ
jgi:prepilin-type N-terminal cleavage/methylation domain-containing protein